MLQNIYHTKQNAFHTAYRVSTLCTTYNILCFITKTVQQPHYFISIKMLLFIMLLVSLKLCYCCCFCKKHNNSNNTFHVHTNHALSLHPIKPPKVNISAIKFKIHSLMQIKI